MPYDQMPIEAHSGAYGGQMAQQGGQSPYGSLMGAYGALSPYYGALREWVASQTAPDALMDPRDRVARSIIPQGPLTPFAQGFLNPQLGSPFGGGYSDPEPQAPEMMPGYEGGPPQPPMQESDPMDPYGQPPYSYVGGYGQQLYG